MGFAEFADRVMRTPARPHTTLALPDPAPAEDGAEAGYFQVRLTDMCLSDDRRWNLDIVPATFFLADFNYGGATIRQPFFVSNQLLSMMPEGMDPTRLRVRFRDTLVVGPTPYAGGDVGLFVGLFQSAIEDRRKALFSVFETLFGSFDLGMLSQYVKVADKLSEEIFRCLGGSDVQCVLAERRVIGQHALPPRGYLAFLRARKGQVDTAGLVVHDGTLQRRNGDRMSPVDELDYCLVRIEQLALRNDYSKMDFHRTWSKARERMRAGQPREAQALMLECASQVEASLDLSEDHKVSLIELYQSKLLATRSLKALDAGAEAATRSGRPSPVRQMQARAAQADFYDEELLAGPFDQIAQLTTRLSKAPSGADSIDEAEIAEHLRQARKGPKPPVSVLVQALAAGSVAA